MLRKLIMKDGMMWLSGANPSGSMGSCSERLLVMAHGEANRDAWSMTVDIDDEG